MKEIRYNWNQTEFDSIRRENTIKEILEVFKSNENIVFVSVEVMK